jgi:hypothetical protein
LELYVWVDLGGEARQQTKVVGIWVKQKLLPGKADNCLSEGGTQRTRLIGLPAI